MKLLLENWRDYVQSEDVQTKVDIVFRIADGFLDEIDGPQIDAIYLIGSRANNTQHKNSDWDFLVVGDGFDQIEDEKIARAEDGNPFPGLDIDVALGERHKNLDIIFSSVPPKADQASKLLYTRDME